MAISKELPWGTEIEMMPGKRHIFHNAKSYTAIYLGAVKNSFSIVLIRKGNKTSQRWHRNFWRPKK